MIHSLSLQILWLFQFSFHRTNSIVEAFVEVEDDVLEMEIPSLFACHYFRDFVYKSAKKSEALSILLLGRLCVTRLRFPPLELTSMFRVSKYLMFQNLTSLSSDEDAMRFPSFDMSTDCMGALCRPTIPRCL